MAAAPAVPAESDGASLVLPPTPEGIAQAGALLRDGHLVAFPTETVYGLGAHALSPTAVASVFAAKGRPPSDPLIVHVPSFPLALPLIDPPAPALHAASALAAALWPGPLTLVCPASAAVPAAVTASTGWVGVRSPRHDLAQRLLREAGVPIAAPSANRFGHVSPTTAQHVVEDLGGRGVRVLDGGDGGGEAGGSCSVGIESTVVKVDAERMVLAVLRLGGVAVEELRRVAPEGWTVAVAPRHRRADEDAGAGPAEGPAAAAAGEQAPGQHVTHYAPDAPTYLVEALLAAAPAAPAPDVLSLSPDELAAAVVVDYGGALAALGPRALAYRDLSPAGDASEAARGLFAALREAEATEGVGTVLLAAAGEGDHSGLAPGVADRVFRAASGRRVRLLVPE
eukprot:CAMPEP_0198428262 /NCGR_PEP_ID=MMETSP1452-20131203/6443_1 /TAXON_ID=1181717 /ORGANISM="Synchroma pusillum, Strain CCMP3072" /LENGTH=396 /DNA_ID=CAMNT_0044148653 /DNA_START=37 /DNA_END=1227 /DNA_ORIENTATION=+